MLKIVLSNIFIKYLKIALKRGFDLKSLKEDYSKVRECHIKPDWLLIYHIDDEELELFLFRTGTHSDLF